MSYTNSNFNTFAIIPFWDEDRKGLYNRCWMPASRSLGKEIQLTKKYHWFEHTSYDSTSPELFVSKSNSTTSETDSPDNNTKKRKNKKTEEKEEQKGKQKKEKKEKEKPNQVYRTRKIRIKPNRSQKLILQKWFAASRLTYNWALYKTKTAKECGFKVKYGKYDIRDLVVPEKVIPKKNPKYSWLTDVPKDIRAQSAFELSNAYTNAFDKAKITGNYQNISYRSVSHKQRSITIDIKAMSTSNKKENLKEISIYPKCMKEPLQLKETLAQIPTIPFKIVYGRNGKYYAHIPQLVDKTNVDNGELIVAIDPGVKPKTAYYSPNGKNAGFIGTEVDVEKLIKIALKIDKISSKIDTVPMTHSKRYKLRKRRFKLNLKIHNRVEECLNYTAKFLCDNFGTILLPDFRVSSMVRREDRRISNKTVRSMLTWRHAALRQKLKDKSEQCGVDLRMVGEAYTSMTCGNCGYLKYDLGREMTFNCNNCGITMHRQLNGPRNVFLKHISYFV